jgi:succinoglycan biosynthesis protein ExoO
MPPAQALVSAIIPVRNGADTIETAIRSALDQTYPAVEVVVVDDASTDDTWQRIEAIGDSRVRAFRQDRNLGEGLTRDAAIDHATGEWVAMLDADDAWHPDRLRTILALASLPGGECVLADNIMRCYTVGTRLAPWKPQWRGSDLAFESGSALLDVADYLSLRTLLVKPVIRRRMLAERGLRHSSLRFSADTEFLIRVLRTGLRLRIAEQPLYLYRRTPRSMSDNPQGAAIMRAMFEALMGELDFTEEETIRVHEWIERLRHEERFIAFVTELRSGRWQSALAMSIGDRRLPADFLRRLPAWLAYRIHVALHGGRSR